MRLEPAGAGRGRPRERLRPGHRFGPPDESGRPAGLTLDRQDAADQRGILLELPVLEAPSRAEIARRPVRLFRRSTDWVRAREVPADPLFGEDEGSRYLPVVDDGNGGWRHVFVETESWHELERAEADDLARGTGARFAVSLEGARRRIWVLTDRLGELQAFVGPAR